MNRFVRYLVITIMLTTYLALTKLLGLEVFGFLTSPFYGGYAGSFLLASLLLGPLGIVIVVFLFLHYFQAYLIAVLLGLYSSKIFAPTNRNRILIGFGSGIIAVLVEYLIAADVSTETRIILNDALSSLIVFFSSIFIFYRLRLLQKIEQSAGL